MSRRVFFATPQRWFGSKRLTTQKQKRDKIAQHKLGYDYSQAYLHSKGIYKFILGSQKVPDRRIKSQIVRTEGPLDQFRFTFRNHTMVTAHFDPQDAFGPLALWRQALRAEYKIYEELKAQNVFRDLYSKIRLSGEAIRINPNGILAILGTKLHIEKLIAEMCMKNVSNFAFAMPLNKMYNADSKSWMLLNQVKSVLSTEAQSCIDTPIDSVLRKEVLSNGVFRIRSLLDAVFPSEDVLEHAHLLVIGKHLRKSREPLTLTIPGGKRDLFETAHKCAERQFRYLTGLDDFVVPAETPAISSVHDDSVVTFVKNECQDVFKIELNEQSITNYAERFKHLSI